MTIKLYKFAYKYMAYEIEFLEREIRAFFPNAVIQHHHSYIELDNVEVNDIDLLSNLTYISHFQINDKIIYTTQYILESSNDISHLNRAKRQNTRYSTHGIHEYKGKYNPQVINAIINMYGNRLSCSIIDPFCGSGTTMLECFHRGVFSVGIDINPLAVYISNVKLKSMQIDCESALQDLDRIICLLNSNDSVDIDVNCANKRMQYLLKWIPQKELQILENILLLTDRLDTVTANLFRLAASDLIREYSYQEPSDLRIRRRITPFPTKSFIETWNSNVIKYLQNIEIIQKSINLQNVDNRAILGDIKNIDIDSLVFDMGITSPPYSTALPYIDTQRISLVWLNLCEPNEIMDLDSELIGSREIRNIQKEALSTKFNTNEDALPEIIMNLIMQIFSNIGSSDGFRKRAVPILLYRYFSDMKNMFISMKNKIKVGGIFALIVGKNSTVINNNKQFIDTPFLLGELAKQCKWQLIELFPLQTYSRYGLHSKNSINDETLIILKNISD